MAAKTNAQKVAESVERRKAKGQVRVPVWVPDTPEAKAKVRELAAELCAAASQKKEQGNG